MTGVINPEIRSGWSRSDSYGVLTLKDLCDRYSCSKARGKHHCCILDFGVRLPALVPSTGDAHDGVGIREGQASYGSGP